MPEVVPFPNQRQPRAVLALVLLLGLNLLNYADRSTLFAVESVIQPDFLKGDARAEEKMGWLASAFLVTYLLAAPLFGILADRWKRWWIVGLGVIIAGAASFGTGWATSFGVLLLMRAIVGLSEAAYGPAAPTIISDMFPEHRRGGALAWFYMAIPVGTALGYVYGGWMNAHSGWRSAFHWLLLPALALGVICFFMKEPTRGAADPSATKRTPRFADYVTFFKTPSFIYNCIGMTMLTFALGGMQFYLPRFFAYRQQAAVGGVVNADEFKKTLEHVNFHVGIIIVLTGIVGTLAGGYLADQLKKKWHGAYLGMSGVAMLVAFPFFLGALYAPLSLAWWCLGTACFFLFLNTGPSNTALANVTHPAVRSSAFALNIFIIHLLGDAISPSLIGWLFGQAKTRGWAATDEGALARAFLIAGVAILVSGMAWLIGARFLKRDTDLAPTRLGA